MQARQAQAVLDRATATMRRGAAFLGGGLAATGAVRPIEGRYAARVTGNGLRELDRFLNLVIDAAIERSGEPSAPWQRNTAAKYGALAGEGGDHRRLLALGRSRACLFYCDGAVRRPDRRGGTTMTSGWPDPATGDLRELPLGGSLVVAPEEIAEVCAFYVRLTERLVAG